MQTMRRVSSALSMNASLHFLDDDDSFVELPVFDDGESIASAISPSASTNSLASQAESIDSLDSAGSSTSGRSKKSVRWRPDHCLVHVVEIPLEGKGQSLVKVKQEVSKVLASKRRLQELEQMKAEFSNESAITQPSATTTTTTRSSSTRRRSRNGGQEDAGVAEVPTFTFKTFKPVDMEEEIKTASSTTTTAGSISDTSGPEMTQTTTTTNSVCTAGDGDVGTIPLKQVQLNRRSVAERMAQGTADTVMMRSLSARMPLFLRIHPR
eukprot:TRINITY_DN834_c0_g1_i3.p1 TRINITY_DN834_c0_g1~~TRINITY_DN834_c0_g1_i3.p1  ORF type:complete len:267 (+),score=61.28 TRINITY_DN834_c0_g1_i3:179-979(+)